MPPLSSNQKGDYKATPVVGLSLLRFVLALCRQLFTFMMHQFFYQISPIQRLQCQGSLNHFYIIKTTHATYNPMEYVLHKQTMQLKFPRKPFANILTFMCQRTQVHRTCKRHFFCSNSKNLQQSFYWCLPAGHIPAFSQSSLRINPEEVAEVFTVPLSVLCDPKNHGYTQVRIQLSWPQS